MLLLENIIFFNWKGSFWINCLRKILKIIMSGTTNYGFAFTLAKKRNNCNQLK